ncbi:MAG: hypothetical protein U0637_09935 [Phycisphaerales bacterium]
MTAGDQKKLAALLKKLRTAAGDQPLVPPDLSADSPDGFDDLLHQLIFSMMLWEATTPQARQAVKRLREHFADANELRVCMADDTVQCLGERYPLARERALRLRHALHDIFTRQHVLSLAALRSMPRRDAAAFLESLDGLPLFVAQRVCIVSLDAAACPVDSRMRDNLARERIVPEDMPAAEASRFIAQQTRAEEALATYLLLQQWSDERAEGTKRARPAKAVAKPAQEGPGVDEAGRRRKPARKAKGAKQ